MYRERQLSWNPEHEKLTVNWMRVVKPNGEVVAEHPEQIQDSDVPAAMGTPMYPLPRFVGFPCRDWKRGRFWISVLP